MPTARTFDAALRRDIRHSLAATALAVLLTGGLLYLAYLLRVLWRAARTPAPALSDAAGATVLVFGKRLRDGRPDHEYRRRLQQARRLADAEPAPTLVLLGGGLDGTTEAAAGLAELRRLGLPPSVPVRLEDQSLDTLENLRNARDLLADGARARPLLLLSNRYHLPRCLSLARGLGLDARPCAAEPALRLREQGLARLAIEAGFLCWLEVGTAWARLIGHRRMLDRVR